MANYNSKSMRIVTQAPGAFRKPYYSPRNSASREETEKSALVWFKPKHVHVYHKGKSDNKPMKNGANYWISADTNINGTDVRKNSGWAMWYDTSIFANIYRDGDQDCDQAAGFTHIISDYNNKNTKNNGYAFEFITDKNDRFKGASPMKVVGLCFRMPSWDHDYWRGPKFPYGDIEGSYSDSNGIGWDTGRGFSDADSGGDRWINRMHLTYVTKDGNLVNKKVLPEGNNGGDYQFSDMNDPKSYTSWWDSKADSYYGSKKRLDKSRMIRVWHNQDIPDDWFFCGFSMSWYIGHKANLEKRHHMTIAGLVPITAQDLQHMKSGGKNNTNLNACRIVEPYCTSRDDALSRIPKMTDTWKPGDPNPVKLWTVSDPDHKNLAQGSVSITNTGAAVWKYS